MAEYTQNLKLEKPTENENFRRQVLNGNMDLIDAAIAGKVNQSEFSAHKADDVNDADGAHGLKIEDGIFTPFLAGVTTAGNNTYSFRNGYYKRVGNICYVWIALYVNTKDINMSGGVYIDGLPFTPKGKINQRYTFTMGTVGNITIPTSATTLVGILESPYPAIYLQVYGSDYANDLQSTAIKNYTLLYISGAYEI